MNGCKPGSGGGGCGGGSEMNGDGGLWKEPASFKDKGDGAKQSLVPAPHGSRYSLSIPTEVGVHPRNPIPEPEPVKLEAPRIPRCADQVALPDPGHVQASNEISYTTLPRCRLTKSQDEKILEIARTKKPEIPLHVASMDKTNVNLKDSFLYIPLQLVLNELKEETTIQLEAPDNVIYSVGARKHSGDLMVIESGWNAFVASLRIEEKDLIIFRSKGKARLEVFILDPSGHEKKPSCAVTRNPSSSTQETSEDSVHIVDPPPRAIIDLSSSDEDDDLVREGTEEFCRAQKRVTRSCAKTLKIASTSSPCTQSGYGASKPHDGAPVKLGVSSVPASNNLGGASQRRYILSQRATLPLQVERKVEEKLKEIGPGPPVLVRVLTTTNVHCTGWCVCEMDFWMEYASACLPDKTRPLVLQLAGKRRLWHATLSVTKGNRRRVYTGWKEFVEGNGLKVGDVCLFELASRNTRRSLTMTVHLVC